MLKKTTLKAIKTYWAPITEIKIKNLLKKPANGGIPATASKVNANTAAKIWFFDPMPEKLIKYFGWNFTLVAALIKIAKVVIVNVV